MSDLAASDVEVGTNVLDKKSIEQIRNEEISLKLSKIVEEIMQGSRPIDLFNVSLIIKYGTEHAKISTTDTLDPMAAIAHRLTDEELLNVKVEELSVIQMDITNIMHLYAILAIRLTIQYMDLTTTNLMIDLGMMKKMLMIKIYALFDLMGNLIRQVKIKHLEEQKKKKLDERIAQYKAEIGFLEPEDLILLDAITMLTRKGAQERAMEQFIAIATDQINAQIENEILYFDDFLNNCRDNAVASVVSMEGEA